MLQKGGCLLGAEHAALQHQRIVGLRGFCEVRRLQRVLKLRDRLPTVLAGAMAGEEQGDVGQVQDGRAASFS